jgi:hypothetical protein
MSKKRLCTPQPATGHSLRAVPGDGPARVEIYASDETIEIYVEAYFETLPEERRCFPL